MRRFAIIIALGLTQAAVAAPPAPNSASPAIEVQEDGTLVHRPSGLRLPRDVHGPKHVYTALIRTVGPNVIVDYGAITLTIGAPETAADLIAVPAGFRRDDDPPALPALLVWGDKATPIVISFLHADGGAGKDWLSAIIVVQGWQVGIGSLYPPEARDTVLRTAEAVWAELAAANSGPPR